MDLFKLQAWIGLNTKDYEKSLSDADSKFHKFGEGMKSAAGKVGDVFAGIGKAATAGVGAASTAFGALAKSALDARADYEQLVGGVDKIFGESSKKVQEYADQAYEKAGLSANEYMETVTGFSASLLQSLGGNTEMAADIANRAIIDMADNANTYGTDIASIQNAYQGFAKQNYTMLDNLKLGYGGTKEEMQRLIVDASSMNEEMKALGVTIDADDLSFGNIINSISVMQRHMKISGTTSNEAAGTISGSVASMKAAWQNFLTGTGSPVQFTKVLKASVDNISNQLNEIIPRLTEGLTELVDAIAPEIPPVIEKMLPSVINGSSKLLKGLAERLPELLETTLPALSKGVVDVSVALVGVMPELITSLKKSIPIVVQTVMSQKDELIKAGKDIIAALFPSDMKEVVTMGSSVVNKLIDGLLSQGSIDALIEAAPKVIENFVDAIKTILLGGEQDGEGGLFGAAKEIVIKIGDYFADEQNRKNFLEAADKVIRSLGSGLISILQNGVAPLMVEVSRAWAEAFIGEINYDDTAWEIISRLGKAFINNMLTGGILGKWLDEASRGYTEQIEENIGVQSTYYTSEGMLSATEWDNAAAKNAYQNYRGYATGFYATRPTRLNNTLVGESGSEVLLPLDTHTEWMDKLADKLNTRTGGDIYITVNAPTGNAEDIVDAIDIALRNRQLAQARSTGGTGWK